MVPGQAAELICRTRYINVACPARPHTPSRSPPRRFAGCNRRQLSTRTPSMLGENLHGRPRGGVRSVRGSAALSCHVRVPAQRQSRPSTTSGTSAATAEIRQSCSQCHSSICPAFSVWISSAECTRKAR